MAQSAQISFNAAPSLINIELANYCNHKCKFFLPGLDTNTRSKGKMDLETFTRITDRYYLEPQLYLPVLVNRFLTMN